VRAAEVYHDVEPLNIGTGLGTSIRELTDLTCELSGFKGNLRWNSDKPDGQMIKILDVSRMKQKLGWQPPTNLRAGLAKTITWYRDHKSEADERF
jgi:GDP-L-fucose synthase